MAWLRFGHLGHIGSFVLLVAAIFEALNVVLWFVKSIRWDPHDQIVRFEALALATFFLGLLLLKAFGFRWPVGLVWMALFFGFTGRVVYLGVNGWLRGKETAAGVTDSARARAYQPTSSALFHQCLCAFICGT